MRIDLHTHSRASDGTDTPAELVRAAAAAGLDVVAITDHDTAAGWAEASAEAERQVITLVRGMEISTRHHHRSVHLLAYVPDPTYPPLAAELQKVLDGRESRVPAMLDRLRAHGRRDHRGRRTPCLARRCGDRPAPHRRRPRDARRGRRPHRGVRPLPRRGPPGLRRPLRRPARAGDPPGRRGRRRVGDRAPVGPRRAGPARRGHLRAAAGAAGSPASRSTTRTTTPRPGSGCGRSPATSTWW